MTEPPRRLPLTDQERLKVATSRMAAGSAAGQSRYAAPAARSGDTNPTPLETTGPGAVIGRADYACATTPGMTTSGGYGWIANNGALSLSAEWGDASSIGYDSIALGLVFNEVGWYRAAARVEIGSATAGDVLTLRVYLGNDEGYETTTVAASVSVAGRALVSVTTPEVYSVQPFPPLVSFNVTNQTAARGQITSGILTVVRLSG